MYLYFLCSGLCSETSTKQLKTSQNTYKCPNLVCAKKDRSKKKAVSLLSSLQTILKMYFKFQLDKNIFFCSGCFFLTFLLDQTVNDACVMLNPVFWETYRDFLLASIYSNQHQTTLSLGHFPLFSQIITKGFFLLWTALMWLRFSV